VNKNARTVSILAILAVVVLVIVFIARDMLLKRNATFSCGDGPRRSIDLRDFTTRYSGYSIELEASVADQGKLSTKINPVQLQQLTEATQNAREFRQYIVAGFNSCAISASQYVQYGARYQALDAVAREINDLASKPTLSQDDSMNLNGLINRYQELAGSLAGQRN